MVRPTDEPRFHDDQERALLDVQERLRPALEADRAGASFAYGYSDHWLIIETGGAPGGPFEPNSIQFYDSGTFLCWRRIDNPSMATLAPILLCDRVYVGWDTETQEAIYVNGSKTLTH